MHVGLIGGLGPAATVTYCEGSTLDVHVALLADLALDRVALPSR